ncbi:kinetochore-associated protein 1, partial [Caerostris darwini]
DELLLSLNEDSIKQILQALPDLLPSQHLISFLCDDFLPLIFLNNFNSIDMVADWLTQHVYVMEISEKDFWPENGSALVAGFLKVIKDLNEKVKRGEASFSASFSFAAIYKKSACADFSVGSLAELSRNLLWLISLKSEFNCKLYLYDFKSSKMNVIFAALDRVDISLIPNIIENFARPFALENELELDFCLEKYIEHTFKSSGFTWWSWDNEMWEERLIAVIESILSHHRWENAALLIASQASVPWSKKIHKLVEKGMEYNCEKREDFQMQVKLAGLKEVLLKYDLKYFSINHDKKLIDRLVNYILKQNRESVLEDVKKVLISISDHIVEKDIYFKYIQFGLTHNKIDQVMDFYPTIPQDIATTCAKKLLRYIKMFLEDEFLVQNQKEIIKNMLYFGIYLIEFLKKTKKSFPENEFLILFKSLTKLQEEFGIFMTFSEISSKSHCQEILESAIYNFVTKNTLPQKVNDFDAVRKHKTISSGLTRLYRLSDILLFEREKVMAFLITTCLQEQKYDLVLKFCKELTDSFLTGNIADILMQVVQHFYHNFSSIKDFSFKIMVDTLFHLSSVAVTYCKEDLIEEYMHVVHLTTYLSSIKEISGQRSFLISPEYTMDCYHSWKFYPFYQDEGFQLDCSCVLDFVMLASEKFIKPNITMNEVALVDPLRFKKCTQQLMKHMIERGQGIAALRTLFFFYHFADISEVERNFSEISSVQIACLVMTIAQKVLSQPRVDSYYAYNLLAFLPKSSQFHSLKELVKWGSNNLKRLAVVARIGMELTKSDDSSDQFSSYENIYKKASLLSRTNIRSIPVELVLNSSNPESSWPVVSNLVLSQNLDLPSVYECCSAFQLDTNRVLLAYLNNILVNSEKKYLNLEFKKSENGCSLQQAKTIVKAITDEDLLYKNFGNFREKISPYSYEILLFILEHMQQILAEKQTINSASFEKEITLLKFLQIYERISPATELEHRRWRALHPIDSKLPERASKYLPFHFFSQDKLHSIINPELMANTLNVWLKMAPTLRLSEDDLILVAVMNTVTSYLKRHSTPYILLYPDMKFVSMIREMISKIKVPESSVACASWVADNVPPGGNKVSFATLAVEHARQWYEQSNNNQHVLNKLQFLLQKSTVERILYKNNLASEEILPLIHSPYQLAEYLIEKFSLTIDQSIKACKAVLEIGKIVKVDLIQIFVKFIFKWLNVTEVNATNLDETFDYPPVAKEFEQDEDEDDKNIFRIINLLLSLPDYLLPNLCEFLKENIEKMPSIQRNRLLFCFVSVFDVSTVAEALGWSANVLESSLIPLLYKTELEKLNFSYTLKMLINCDKTELVQRILSSNFRNPKVLIFCVRLCLEFNIWDAPIWEVILRRITMKAMNQDLQNILQATQGHLSYLWHSKTFIEAWKCILSEILRMKHDSTVSLMAKLYKAILRCPCISFMDVQFLIRELNDIIRTSDEKAVKEIEPVTDMPSLILILKNLFPNTTQCNENH